MDTERSGGGTQRRTLEQLTLRYVRASADEWQHLAAAPKLQKLVLQQTGINEQGLSHLEALTNLQTLELLEPELSVAAVARLREALPNCNIIWDGNELEEGKSGYVDRDANYALQFDGKNSYVELPALAHSAIRA